MASPKRAFRKEWQIGRNWLLFSVDDGMWCLLCYKYRHDSRVVRFGRHTNPLVYATKNYRVEIVVAHAETSYHLRAVHLESMKTAATVQAVAVRLPPTIVPQVKVIFRTIYSMAQRGISWSQLRAELELQTANGVIYHLRYLCGAAEPCLPCLPCLMWYRISRG